MQDQIVELIKMSFVPDSEKLKYSTAQLEDLAKQSGNPPYYSGFCPMMMMIADSAAYDLQVRQSALVQFKNAIKRHWNSTKFSISAADKSQIVNNLVNAFIRTASIPLLLRLYR